MASYRYTERHDLKATTFLCMMKSLESSEKRRYLTKEHEQAVALFKHFPEDLQVEIHMDSRGPSLRAFNFAMHPIVQGSGHFFQRFCHETIVDRLVFYGETIFEEGRRSNNMFLVERAVLHYQLAQEFLKLRFRSNTGNALQTLMHVESGRSTGPDKKESSSSHHSAHIADAVKVTHGDCLCEASLWTTWKYRGDLVASSDGNLLCVDTNHFSHIVEELPDVCFVAILYARECVSELNDDKI